MNSEQMTTGYKKLQDGIFESTRKLWLAGLGTLSTVEEEGTEIFGQLVEKGRKVEKKSRQRLSKTKAHLESGTEELTEKLDRQVSGVLQKMGVPTSAQVQDLTARVEQLMEQVDRAAPTAPAKTSTARASTTKATKTVTKKTKATA